jgi:hypothetical protein
MQHLACKFLKVFRGYTLNVDKKRRPPTAQPKTVRRGSSATDSTVRDLAYTGVPTLQNRKLATLPAYPPHLLGLQYVKVYLCMRCIYGGNLEH